MKQNGFDLVDPKGTTTNLFSNKYYEDGLGQFSKVIENLSEIRKTDEIFRKYYNEAYEMKPDYSIVGPLVRLSSFNTYFKSSRKDNNR